MSPCLRHRRNRQLHSLHGGMCTHAHKSSSIPACHPCVYCVITRILDTSCNYVCVCVCVRVCVCVCVWRYLLFNVNWHTYMVRVRVDHVCTSIHIKQYIYYTQTVSGDGRFTLTLTHSIPFPGDGTQQTQFELLCFTHTFTITHRACPSTAGITDVNIQKHHTLRLASILI